MHGSLDGYVQDVLEICKACDLQDVIFVGHSVSSSHLEQITAAAPLI